MFRLTLHATISEYASLPQYGPRIPRLKLIYHHDNDGLYSTAFNNENHVTTLIYTGDPRYLCVTTNHIRSAKHIMFLFWPLAG